MGYGKRAVDIVGREWNLDVYKRQDTIFSYRNEPESVRKFQKNEKEASRFKSNSGRGH